MKKQWIIFLIILIPATSLFAQNDTAVRKRNTILLNANPPPYNPIPPSDMSSAPKDANFFEIAISKNIINAKGIKGTGVRGCDNCNVAGKISFSGITKETFENANGSSGKITDGTLPRCCKTNCCCLKNNADGKIYELPLNSDGSFNGNVPQGEYTMIYGGNIIATKCGVKGNPIAVKMNGPTIKN